MANIKKISVFSLAAAACFVLLIIGLWIGSPKPSKFPSYEESKVTASSKTFTDATSQLLTLPNRSAQLRSWNDGSFIENWAIERKFRENIIDNYLNDNSATSTARYGFRAGHTPAYAWGHFENSPVGFNGVPYVLLKTLIDISKKPVENELTEIARLWASQSELNKPGQIFSFGAMNSLGMPPHPSDYNDGIAVSYDNRDYKMPYGLAWQSELIYRDLTAIESIIVDARLHLKKLMPTTSLAVSRLYSLADDITWEEYRSSPVESGVLDRVHFSCAACHMGRVIVDNKVKFLPGSPNTEVSPQFYSRLLMETAALLVLDGFDTSSNNIQYPSKVVPNPTVISALHKAMIKKVQEQPESFYGPTSEEKARAKLQVMWVSDNFSNVIKDLIGVGIKTHFIYRVAAENNGYTNYPGDVFSPMVGQMDAFGIASGLVALHMKRSDNGFMKFIASDNPKSPFIEGFSDKEYNWSLDQSLKDAALSLEQAAERTFAARDSWLPKYPAPIDIKAVNWVGLNILANWDGNQGASSRTLSSGASATGDPSFVNVKAHEPLNPFINHLPPSPYPFDSVDLQKAIDGRILFQENCESCHRPMNGTIYTAKELKTDSNRSSIISSVSRFGLSSLVMEACILGSKNEEIEEANYWCVPPGTWEERTSDYFANTPLRVSSGLNGYKADALFGIWSQGPYLHNGSVPTLGHLICPQSRPKLFLRGSIIFDEDLVGFEWSNITKEPYSIFDVSVQREYNTNLSGFDNSGHYYGSNFCPNLSGLDPHTDRSKIEKLIKNSDAGKIIEYLKLR